MTVDFAFGKAPAYRVATLPYKGKWSENIGRPEFAKLVAWAAQNHVKTGKWIFRWLDDGTMQACLEIRGPAKGAGAIRIRTLPASAVARITFDPDVVSSRVVYHGLNDWLRWRKKEKEIRSIRSSREIYASDPWGKAAPAPAATVEYLVSR